MSHLRDLGEEINAQDNVHLRSILPARGQIIGKKENEKIFLPQTAKTFERDHFQEMSLDNSDSGDNETEKFKTGRFAQESANFQES